MNGKLITNNRNTRCYFELTAEFQPVAEVRHANVFIRSMTDLTIC